MNIGELTISLNADVRGAQDLRFHQWAGSSLLWLPEHGMGFYPVEEPGPYDADYFEKYRRYSETALGEALLDSRIRLVMRHLDRRYETLVDVGVGCGTFLEEIRRYPFNAYGYDVNPEAVRWLEGRELFGDPREIEGPIEVLTFWDSLEHIADAGRFVSTSTRWVFCSLPIVPGDGPPRSDWKHFRRDEHCWYWTRAGLLSWMRELGFQCVEHNTSESLLGREDIETFAFRRVQ